MTLTRFSALTNTILATSQHYMTRVLMHNETHLYLDPINSFERPLSMVLYRLVAKFLSFFLSREHAVVTTVTAAVPLLPLNVKRLLQIPRAINGVSIRGKITVLKALVPHTSSLLTLQNTSPRSVIKFLRINKGMSRAKAKRIQMDSHLSVSRSSQDHNHAKYYVQS